ANVFALPPTGPYGHRLVVDFKGEQRELPGRKPGRNVSLAGISLLPLMLATVVKTQALLGLLAPLRKTWCFPLLVAWQSLSTTSQA
ncbi:MAG: hypothetical protein LAT66_08400, partial [Alkalimonas sp.]|nr:hypothetical protein [Alkalimonas sp.]